MPVTTEHVSSTVLRAYSLKESNEVDSGGVEEMAPQNTPLSCAKYFEARAPLGTIDVGLGCR